MCRSEVVSDLWWPTAEQSHQLTVAVRISPIGSDFITVQNQGKTGEEMRSWMKNAGRVALISGGLFAIGSGIASADSTDGSNGVLSGNQVYAPASVPANVSGNAGAVHGRAAGDGAGRGAQVANAGYPATRTTSGKNGVLSGNQVSAPVNAPLNACGNALAVHGEAKTTCGGTKATAPMTPAAGRCGAGAQPAATAPVAATAPTVSAPTACGLRSIAAPPARTSGNTGPVTRLLPAAADSAAQNAGTVGSQDLVVLERLTAARQSVGTVAGR
jgi:hypothetical protein